MSVINKMLQELDRRNAMAGAEAAPPPQQVKVVGSAPGHHEWFWRILALLVLATLAWVGWVAYQLQPRAPLVTEKALEAQAQPRKAAAAAAVPSPAVPQTVAAATAVAAPEPKPQPAQAEIFRLARAIETPIAERKPQPVKVETAKKVVAPEPVVPPPAAAKASVDKRERGRANDPAESQFRRAAALLNQGRVSEAEQRLVGALQADPGHQAARQAYVALLLEQRRMSAAQRVLREALEANPAQPTFALALARVYAEQRDYLAALEVIDHAGAAAQNADFQGLRGAVLQRLDRHAEAVEAYRRAAQSAPEFGSAWAGLGISLEVLGRKAQAAEAFRRALGAGPLNREVREYAEARLKALE